MSNTTDHFPSLPSAQHKRTCRMAYSLNNTQNVLCTIVSDQPLFYMECDDMFDEDGLFDDDFSAFDKEMNDVRQKANAYERFSVTSAQSSENKLYDFINDARDLCDRSIPSSISGDIDDLVSLLSQSRFGAALLEVAKEHDVQIVRMPHVKTAFYDRVNGKILMGTTLAPEDGVLALVRELRKHWQHRQGVLLDPLTFHPDQAVLVHRAQKADLAVSMVRLGWELQLAGKKDAWERLECSSMADLARAFAREACTDFRSLNNGQACSAVFETWFLSERCRLEDKTLIQRMLVDQNGYVFGDVQQSRHVTMDMIGALGSLPFGKNYLSPYVQMILNDPVFTDVRDRSNANFLWFIKFERSFHEAEQELQSGPVIHKDPARGSCLGNQQDHFYEQQEENIVSLPLNEIADYNGIEASETGTASVRESNIVFVQF